MCPVVCAWPSPGNPKVESNGNLHLSPQLARVQALGTTSHGMTFMYAHTYDRAVVLHDDPIDNTQFAWEIELLEEVSMEERTFDVNEMYSLTLLMAFLFDGRRRFIEYH